MTDIEQLLKTTIQMKVVEAFKSAPEETERHNTMNQSPFQDLQTLQEVQREGWMPETMPPPRPTPETDAEERRTHGIPHGGEQPLHLYVKGDFARNLERQRDEARDALSGRIVSCSQCNEMARKLDEAERRLRLSGFYGDNGEEVLSTSPPARVPFLEHLHSLLDGEPAQIVRNAKDGYPEGREDRMLSIEERIEALKHFAADYQRWHMELEELTGRKHP